MLSLLHRRGPQRAMTDLLTALLPPCDKLHMRQSHCKTANSALARQAAQRQPIDGGARPNRDHRVTVLTQHERLNLGWGQREFVRDERTEA